MLSVLQHFASPDSLCRPAPQEARLVIRICADEPALLAALRQGHDVLVADGSVPLGARVFEGGGRLRRVISTAVGPLAWLDLEAATQHGVAVALPRTQSQNAVAEHTLALLLTLVRRLDRALAAGRSGAWSRQCSADLRGAELGGLILGIVGWGRIGRLVALKAEALGMRLVVHSPRANPADVPYPLLGLRELLEQADVVSLHARVNPARVQLLGEGELRAMKPTAYLINTARGALIDEAALVSALQGGWIAGAALDVLAQEPPPADHPLLRLPNALVTPHMGWNTNEVRALELADVREELRRALAGEAPLNCANPEALR